MEASELSSGPASDNLYLSFKPSLILFIWPWKIKQGSLEEQARVLVLVVFIDVSWQKTQRDKLKEDWNWNLILYFSIISKHLYKVKMKNYIKTKNNNYGNLYNQIWTIHSLWTLSHMNRKSLLQYIKPISSFLWTATESKWKHWEFKFLKK